MANREETIKDYHERINRVLVYIDNNLSERLDLEKLAGMSNFSVFHFHRIMRAHLNEPLGSFVQRLRLDKAAFMLTSGNETIQDIAWLVGYENPASLSKAFKKRFGIAPFDFRNDNTPWKFETQFVQFNKTSIIMDIKPKIKKRDPKKVIFVQSVGAYDSPGTDQAWKTVCDFASKKKLWGFGTEMLGVSLDDPNITEESKLRYEACITISKTVEAEGPVGVKTIEGGKYAVFRHNGPYQNLNQTYTYIFREWLPVSGKELRDLPCFEKCINNPDKTPVEKLKTDIYIPLKD